MAFQINLSGIAQTVMAQVEAELPSRAIRSANELLNAKNNILRGQRSGRWYGKHQASAAGESPANWTGHLRDSGWKTITDSHLFGIESETAYAQLLEDGTPGGQMAPRPYKDKITQEAEPLIEAIYKEPWHIKI